MGKNIGRPSTHRKHMASKKMMVTLLICAFLLWLQVVIGQPDIDWDKTFGEQKNDRGIAFQKDGTSYVVVGYTIADNGKRDVYLVKTHSDGEKDWDKTFGEAGDDMGWSLLTASDGYVIAGTTESYGSEGKDLLLLKTDLDGEETWTKHFGGPGDQWGTSLLKNTDGYLIAGVSESPDAKIMNGYLVKTDLDGNKEWEYSFGGSKNDLFNSIQKADEGYILTGATESYGSGGKDLWLMKIDSDGTEVWNKQFGESKDEWGNAVIKVSDEYIITGVKDETDNRDMWLIKVDLDGSQKWDNSFGGSGNDGGWDIISDGSNYLVAGYTESEGNGNQDMWLVKTDSDGNEVWKQTFGESKFDLCRSILRYSTGIYVLVGWTESKGNGGQDIWLLKTKKEGT